MFKPLPLYFLQNLILKHRGRVAELFFNKKDTNVRKKGSQGIESCSKSARKLAIFNKKMPILSQVFTYSGSPHRVFW